MMKFMKYLLVASMLLFMAAPALMAADKEPVVIGLQGPITGAWAYEGQMAKQSCEIAADLINKKGGILGGRKVVIKVEDDAGEPKTGALAARRSWARRKWWQRFPPMAPRYANRPPTSTRSSRR